MTTSLPFNSQGAPNFIKERNTLMSAHFIRVCQEAKEIDVKYITTAEQLADSFTKPLPNPRFSHLREAIGIVPVPEI